MPAETRSRGAPAPSRVYHATPALQQLQFASRRKAVRTYGRYGRGRGALEGATPAGMRQQTLTQLDFVSSFDEDGDGAGPIVLSDSDDDEFARGGGGDKENWQPSASGANGRRQDGDHAVHADEDEEPVASGRKQRSSSLKRPRGQEQSTTNTKRRRTLGDQTDAGNARARTESRRKTMGDSPSSSPASKYHTQTLTQFMGRRSFIKDSDDEEEAQDDGVDDGFHDWLGPPGSPSPPAKRALPSASEQRQRPSPSVPRSKGDQAANQAAREESVVPQTPAKRIRFEIPSSSQQTTPLSTMLDRYGPLGDQPSPLKGRSPNEPALAGATPARRAKASTPVPAGRAKLVVEDSFATESWGSANGSPTKGNSPQKSQLDPVAEVATSPALGSKSSSLPEAMSTPSKRPDVREDSTELGERIAGDEGQASADNAASSQAEMSSKGPSRTILEIPDSDEDDDDEGFDDDYEANNTFVAGKETQLALNELASSEEHSARPSPSAPSGKISPDVEYRPPPDVADAHQLPPTPPPAKPIRKPLHDTAAPLQFTQTQPVESQRVPLAILQSLPPAAVRTDIVLPLVSAALASIVAGLHVHITLPFKVPAQVVRFWLFDGTLLRYMASAEPAVQQPGGAWRHHLPQVYELNNPQSHDDMRDDWMNDDVGRYQYVPPAVVSQMLWNLRHALFADADGADGDGNAAEDEDAPGSQHEPWPLPRPGGSAKHKAPTPSLSVSQQLDAQIQSDIAHSTQLAHPDDVVPSTPEGGEDEHHDDNAPGPAPMQPPTRPPRTLPPPPPPSSSFPPAPPVRPSQATTASQASSPSQPPPLPPPPPSSIPHPEPSQPLHRHSSFSSSTLTFRDYGSASSLPLLPPADAAAAALVPQSQLLSRSQMLPDSLLRDHDAPPAPPPLREMWDSDDGGD